MTIENQQKLDELLQNNAIKINTYIKNNQHNFSKEYFMACIIDADPDKKCKYSEWILNNVLNDNILWEDVESGNESKTHNTLLKLNSINIKNINEYNTLDSLIQKINQFKDKIMFRSM